MIKLSAVEAFHAVRFDGAIYDTGSKIGFLSANVAYALARPELAADLRAEIARILQG
jgi:UTP--glucose-1-phosphate uridylyltransferase